MASELATALAKAQAEMKNAHLNKVNTHFKSKYADLAGIRDAVMPHLAKNGIAVTQVMDVVNGDSMVLITKLIHASGETIESVFPVAADASKPHAMGSAITYARRYSLSAICGISADEDDDGNAAQEAPPVVKTLSKANARAVYEALQAGVDQCGSLDELRIWGRESKAQVALLPADWQEILRTRFEDKMNALKSNKETVNNG